MVDLKPAKFHGLKLQRHFSRTIWDYHRRPKGYEVIGVVEAVGADVRDLKKSDFVIMPSAYADGTCAFCH